MANPTIKDSILIHRNVGESLQLLRKRMTDLSITDYIQDVEEIENDYRIMCNSLSHNMRDPQGEIVYNSYYVVRIVCMPMSAWHLL